jgi:hypothetical protein
MYDWQVGRFFRDAEVRNEFVPLLYQQFDATPSARRPAFFRLNEDLLPTIRSGNKRLPQLREVQTGGQDHLRRRPATHFTPPVPTRLTRREEIRTHAKNPAMACKHRVTST